jgi:hypothetical protein
MMLANGLVLLSSKRAPVVMIGRLHPHSSTNKGLSCVIVVVCSIAGGAQVDPYPHNAVTCERCHTRHL